MPFKSFIQDFLTDRSGNVAIICAAAIVPMILIAGGATDIARHEAYRVQLQDGVDRAVLAAASLTQTRSIEQTVDDYLQTVAFIDEVDVSFSNKSSFNAREVTVSASYPMETAFLPLLGINTIMVNATATAQEKRSNLEISLILDISGSMREGNPTKIGLLRPAAKSFIDQVLTEDTKGYTSLSLVPFAGSVNPGAVVMDGLGVPRQHNYSSCVEFNSSDYGVGLIPFSQRSQVAHFTYYNNTTPYSGRNGNGVSYTGLKWSWCPEERTSISYLSNDAAALKTKIDNLEMHDGTGSAIAMNWGMMLLEPGARPMIAAAAQSGIVPAQFSNRPANFDDPNTLKVIVLMTDGEISDQYRPKQYAYPRPCNAATTGSQSDRCNTTTQSQADAVNKMYAVCNRAKNNQVLVFTIGFQVNSTAQTQMRNCASSSSHFYNVSGLDISSAFQSIASAIQAIRLTQ